MQAPRLTPRGRRGGSVRRPHARDGTRRRGAPPRRGRGRGPGRACRPDKRAAAGHRDRRRPASPSGRGRAAPLPDGNRRRGGRPPRRCGRPRRPAARQGRHRPGTRPIIVLLSISDAISPASLSGSASAWLASSATAGGRTTSALARAVPSSPRAASVEGLLPQPTRKSAASAAPGAIGWTFIACLRFGWIVP